MFLKIPIGPTAKANPSSDFSSPLPFLLPFPPGWKADQLMAILLPLAFSLSMAKKASLKEVEMMHLVLQGQCWFDQLKRHMKVSSAYHRQSIRVHLRSSIRGKLKNFGRPVTSCVAYSNRSLQIDDNRKNDTVFPGFKVLALFALEHLKPATRFTLR